MKTQKHKNTKTQKHRFSRGLANLFLIFSSFTFFLGSCQMQPLDEILPETESVEQFQSPFQIESVDQSVLKELGQKASKRFGFDVIQSAQSRKDSDFLFDFESRLLTIGTLQRKTFTIPFLEMNDVYSTFNLVMVSDSINNIIDQYVLQYEFDNGIAVSSWQNTSHPNYNNKIRGIFDRWDSRNQNATPEQVMEFLQSKMQELSQLIKDNPTVKINDLEFN